MTALQKHVEFFDRNKDGIITVSELFEGEWLRPVLQFQSSLKVNG
jgi:Ca2+-binding EF-hand superfamily protein